MFCVEIRIDSRVNSCTDDYANKTPKNLLLLHCGDNKFLNIKWRIKMARTTEMPLQDMFWGAYFGSCTDKFGV